MEYFPFFFDLRGRRVLLVGGGEVALRKAELLTRAGACLRVVASLVVPPLQALAKKHGGEVLQRNYQTTDLDGAMLVVAATDDDALNARIKADAAAVGVPVNVVDCPALCDFIFPAIVDRTPLVVAVSSGGHSPVLARRLRAKIEMLLPSGVSKLADLCGRFRDKVQVALPIWRRRHFWESALDGAASEAALSGNITLAEKILAADLEKFASANRKGVDSPSHAESNLESPTLQTQRVDSPSHSPPAAADGEVYLIGAGPGDADLLTFRAHRLLQKADVVVYDRLVSAAVLDLARRDAERIYAGKARQAHAMPQEEINQLLINLARRGKRVARLKGGDPFIFGRGGEELLALRAAGVRCYVAAGLTAALGCAAAAGVPLTHRGVARGVRFCTAYARDMHDAAYWRHLAADSGTLVLYMAGATLSAVADNLMAGGRAAATPMLVVCGGTLPEQRLFRGVLSTIASVVKSSAGGIFSPTLIIIGEVCALQTEAAADDIADSALALSAAMLDGSTEKHEVAHAVA